MSSTQNNHLAPPSGPPPPEVPSGWVARWDPHYQTFFYVNLATKQSQWEKPPGTIDRPRSSSSSGGDYYDSRPPPYSASSTPNLRSTEHNPQPQYSSLIPQDSHLPAHQPAPRVATPEQTSSSKGHGLTAKIGKFIEHRAAAAAARPRYPVYAQSHYGYPGRPMYGGYGGGMYGPPMMMGGGYGPRRGGLGAGGGAALGLGGGLLGGMMLGNALDNDYQDGFQDGADFGGDYGGGDFGGGDFGGGDFGGGDF